MVRARKADVKFFCLLTGFLNLSTSTLGLDNSLLWRAVLRISTSGNVAGLCPRTSSIYSPAPVATTKNVCKHCHMSPGSGNKIGNHWILCWKYRSPGPTPRNSDSASLKRSAFLQPCCVVLMGVNWNPFRETLRIYLQATLTGTGVAVTKSKEVFINLTSRALYKIPKANRGRRGATSGLLLIRNSWTLLSITVFKMFPWVWNSPNNPLREIG